ncbi:hypothetical protein ACA910_000578 [Epithemia clementina (nom. ined.)]
MVRRSASFDPPEGRSSLASLRDDPPTIVNSTAAHNNKPTPRSSTSEEGAKNGTTNNVLAFRYEEEETPSRAATDHNYHHQQHDRESLYKENESSHTSSSHLKHITQLVVEVDSEDQPAVLEKEKLQHLELDLGKGESGALSGNVKSDDLPESLLELSSSLKSKRRNSNPRERSSSSLPRPFIQGNHVVKERDQLLIMPSVATNSAKKPALSRNASSRVVIENMPPHGLSTPASDAHTEPMPETTPLSLPHDNSNDGLPSSGASASKTTYLTRKAHQFSSLKKKRNSNLLHKMFCNSENSESGGDAQQQAQEMMTVISQVDIPLVDSGIKEEDDYVEQIRAEATPPEGDHEHQQAHHKQTTQTSATKAIPFIHNPSVHDEKNWNTGASCMTFSDALDLTKDAFRLTAEADVRHSIQTAVAGALAAVRPPEACANIDTDVKVKSDLAAVPSATDHILSASISEDKRDDKTDQSIGSRLRWKADNPAAQALKQKALEASRRSSAGATPVSKPSGLGNVSGAGSTKSASVMSATSASFPTPARKPMFPSTIEYWEKMTSGSKNGPSSRIGPVTPSKLRALVLVENSESSVDPGEETEVVWQEPSPEKRDPEEDNQEDKNLRQIPSSTPEPQSIEAADSGTESIESVPSDEPAMAKDSKSASFASIYDETAFLPNRAATDTPCKTSSSSLDRQNSITKARSDPVGRWQKGNAHRHPQDVSEICEVKKTLEPQSEQERRNLLSKLERLSKDLARTKSELRKKEDELEETRSELEEKQNELRIEKQANSNRKPTPRTESEYQQRLDEALVQTKIDAERLLQENGLRWKEEHEIELKQVKRSYERKLLENKDQLALANRKIKLQQDEVERLETQLRQDGKHAPSPSLATRHFDRIDYDRMLAEKEAEHKKIVDALKAELEKTKEGKVLSTQTPDHETSGMPATGSKDYSSVVQAELDDVRINLQKAKQDYENQIRKAEAKTKENEAALSRLTKQLTHKDDEIKRLKEAAATLVSRENVEDLKKRVSSLENELAEERKKHGERKTERETTLEEKELSLQERENKLDQRESDLEHRENELQLTTEELEETSKELETTRNELSQSEEDLEVERRKLEDARKKIESMSAEIENENSRIEASKKTLKQQRIEFETEKKMAKANSAPNSPLRSPSPSRLKKPSSTGIPRRAPKPDNDSEASHEREKAELRKKIAELEEEAKLAGDKHQRVVQEIRSSSENQIESIKQEMEARSAVRANDGEEKKSEENSEMKNDLLRQIEDLEAEKKNQLEVATNEFKEKEAHLLKKISLLEEQKNQLDVATIEFKEKEEHLLETISLLEEQAATTSKEHERTLQQFRSSSEEEITRIKADMEQRLEMYMSRERELKDTLSQAASWEKAELLSKIEELELRKNEERSGGLREVQKKEDLLQRIDALEKREQKLIQEHEQAMSELKQSSSMEIEKLKQEMGDKEETYRAREKELSMSLSQTASYAKEELLQKIETLEGELEANKSAYKLVTMKIAALEKENKAAEAAHIEELAELQMKTSLEVKSLQDAITAAGGPTTAIEMFRKEKEELLEQIRNMESQLQSEQLERVDKLEEFREQHSIHVEKLKRECAAKLEVARQETEKRIEELQREHEMKIEEMESSYVGGTTNFAGFSSEELAKLKAREKELTETISSMQSAAEERAKKFEQQIKEVAESHAKELEDLISQLDLVEAEHLEKVKSKERIAEQKDEIITALSNQLSEALDRMKSNEASSKGFSALQEELEEARSQIESLTYELDSLKKTHENFVSEAEEIREKACDAAREEMIERAEGQFRQANELYVKLKKQYDTSKGKVEKLSKELKEAKSQLESHTHEREESESSLRAEVAELKAQNAKIEAQSAQKAKDYRREMEGLLKAAEDFEKKCKEAESNAKAAKKALNAMTLEKNELQQNLDTLMSEHEEMKQVCEELMAELEGRTHEC